MEAFEAFCNFLSVAGERPKVCVVCVALIVSLVALLWWVL